MSETTVGDELIRHQDTPSMGLPREAILAFAMAGRSIAGALSTIRERNGRAAWSPADEAARIHLAADSASIDGLSTAQAAEWNDAVAAGEVNLWSERVPGGLVIADAQLSDGAHIVQGTLGDRTVTVAAGSEATAAHLREWLIANPSHDSLADLREAARDVAASRRAGSGRRAPSHAASVDVVDGAVVEDDVVLTDLKEKLHGQIPDSVFDDRRWQMAERTYADLVERGADPDTLVEAAAGLNFSGRVKTPAGLVAWQLRKAAQGQTSPTSEEQARREAATEWLSTATDSAPDRARASTLVGQIDSDFDAQLAAKYSGLLTASDATSQWHDHASRAKSETDLTEQHRDNALDSERVTEEELAVVHGPTGQSAVEHTAAVDHADHAADERYAMEAAESARVHEAGTPAEQASAAPLASRAGTVPAKTPNRGAPKPHTSRPVQTQTQVRARTR